LLNSLPWSATLKELLMKFNDQRSVDIIGDFTSSLWEHCKERFSPETVETLAIYLTILFGDPGTLGTWKRAYAAAFGHPFSKEKFLTEEEIYISMVELCAMYVHKYRFELNPLLDLLFAIKYRPEEFPTESAFWKDSVALFKEKMENSSYHPQFTLQINSPLEQ